MHLRELLFEGTNEPLGHVVALRLPDKAGPGGDAQEPQLILEGMARLLGTMIMLQHQTHGDAFHQFAEVLSNVLMDGLQSLKAITGTCGMDTHNVTHAVIHGHEHRGHAFWPRHHMGGIGARHPIRCLWDDSPVVGPGLPSGTDPARGLQAVGANQTPHLFLENRGLTVSEPGTDFPELLTTESQSLRLGKHLEDSGHQGLITKSRFSAPPTTGPSRVLGRLLPPISASIGQHPTSGTPGPYRRHAGRRPTRPGSWRRPPLGKRGLSLELGKLHLQQLLVHYQIPHQTIGALVLLLKRRHREVLSTSRQSCKASLQTIIPQRDNSAADWTVSQRRPSKLSPLVADVTPYPVSASQTKASGDFLHTWTPPLRFIALTKSVSKFIRGATQGKLMKRPVACVVTSTIDEETHVEKQLFTS